MGQWSSSMLARWKAVLGGLGVGSGEPVYRPRPGRPDEDLHWVETCLNVQSAQFMIDALPGFRALLSRCERGVPVRVLDVGAASGAGSNVLASLYSGIFLGYQARVEAVEIEPYWVRYVRARFPLLHYTVADAWDLRPDRPWDIVTCSHTIEHVERPVAFARHLQSLARQGVLINAPYNETDRIPGHINTIDDDFLAQAGAEDIRILDSPAWQPAGQPDPRCVVFLLPGLAGFNARR